MVDIAAPIAAEREKRPLLSARRLAIGVDFAVPILSLLLVVTAWELGAEYFEASPFLLPPPSAIAQGLIALVDRGVLLDQVLVTCGEALTGFAIASVAGTLVGALVARSRLVEKTLYPYLVAIQTMPKIALAPLFVAWFGFGLASKVAVAALIAFFPVLVSAIVGLKSCDEGKVDVLRALSASEWQVFRLVRFPAALPYLFTGLEIAIVFALTGAIVGEFVGSRGGLGYQMIMSNSEMEIAQVFAVVVLLGAIGFVFHLAIARLKRRVLYWSPDDGGRSAAH